MQILRHIKQVWKILQNSCVFVNACDRVFFTALGGHTLTALLKNEPIIGIFLWTIQFSLNISSEEHLQAATSEFLMNGYHIFLNHFSVRWEKILVLFYSVLFICNMFLVHVFYLHLSTGLEFSEPQEPLTVKALNNIVFYRPWVNLPSVLKFILKFIKFIWIFLNFKFLSFWSPFTSKHAQGEGNEVLQSCLSYHLRFT